MHVLLELDLSEASALIRLATDTRVRARMEMHIESKRELATHDQNIYSSVLVKLLRAIEDATNQHPRNPAGKQE